MQCRRGGFGCLWIGSVASPDDAVVDPSFSAVQRRAAVACRPCRLRKVRSPPSLHVLSLSTPKIRCPGPVAGPDTCCSRCERLSLDCAWETRRARSKSAHAVASAPSNGSSDFIAADHGLRSGSAGSASPTSEASQHDTACPASRTAEVDGPVLPSNLETKLANKVEVIQHARNYFSTVHCELT